MDDLKTPREWAKVTGIEIVDADGWRGRTGRSFTDAISEEEFRYRASYSTVHATRPVWNESPKEALDAAMNADPDEEPEPDEGDDEPEGEE